jgi:dihydroorotate dehydrogenase electron transfer subunit
LSAYHTEANRLRTTPILDVKTESPTVKTLYFKDRLCAGAKPGQFLMLWVPGVDEIPFSILGGKADGIVRVAVRKVGEATQALHEKKTHDLIGIRGPFGNSFSLSKGRVLIVAGGTGTVPMLFLTKTLLSMARITFVLGAKTKKELIFFSEIKRQLTKNKLSLITSTEDGTCGITGLCTEPVEQILRKEKPDMVYACGPEQMLLKIFEICEKSTARLEVSLERMMRCAIGLCGSCVIGKYRVCTDGPVFTKKQLQETKGEFGFFKHDLNGRKLRI